METTIDPSILPFYHKLFDFQKESVKFGIKKHGRVLIADEMGVGKTVQSLALAYLYKTLFPLLIICPSSLKFNWKEEIKKWYTDADDLPLYKDHQIHVIKKGGMPIPS